MMGREAELSYGTYDLLGWKLLEPRPSAGCFAKASSCRQSCIMLQGLSCPLAHRTLESSEPRNHVVVILPFSRGFLRVIILL